MDNRAALIIGINNYEEQRSHLKSLRYAEADAMMMEEVLRTHFGFATKLMLGREATQANIWRTTEEYRTGMDLELFLFYFAGHGEVQRSVGTHFLHCFGADARFTSHSINVSEYTNKVRGDVPAQYSVFIIDACRNEAYLDVSARGSDEGMPDSVLDNLRRVTQASAEARDIVVRPRDNIRDPQLQYFLLACGAQQRTYEDDELRHGIFTHSLVDVIRKSGKTKPLGEMRRIVGGNTRKRCIERNLPPQLPEWIEPSLPIDLYLGDPPTHLDEKHPSAPLDEMTAEIHRRLGAADALKNAGQWKQAREVLRKAFVLAPENEEVCSGLAEVRAQLIKQHPLKLPSRATVSTVAEWVEQLIANPDQTTLLLKIKELQPWLADIQEQPRLFDELAALDSSNGLWQALSPILHRHGLLSPSQAERIDKLISETTELLNAADGHLSAGQFQQAEGLYLKVRSREPNNKRALDGLTAVRRPTTSDSSPIGKGLLGILLFPFVAVANGIMGGSPIVLLFLYFIGIPVLRLMSPDLGNTLTSAIGGHSILVLIGVLLWCFIAGFKEALKP